MRPFLIILILAAFFRFYGLNWDQNHHLHPDERFLTMVANSLRWPTSLSQYFDTTSSPLNPHNAGFGFYVYGTSPVFLVKLVAEFLGLGDYNRLTLVGRAVSGLFDLGTVILVYLIALKLFSRRSVALLAMFFYAISVLPIQLSHFFAVDPYLTFFLTLSFYLLLTRRFILLGLAFGLAVASKISALIFLPIITLGLLISRPKIIFLLLFTITIYFTVRLAQPYLFDGLSLNPKVLANWQQLKSYEDPNAWFPPGTQWLHTPKFIYPLGNLLLWGLGLPLGIISVAGAFYLLYRYHAWPILLLAAWIFLLFIYQGTQYAMPMRYFYPIYPFLAISAGALVSDSLRRLPWGLLPITLTITFTSLWPAAFVSIYSRPVSRVSASEWIIKTVPAGSRLSCEHWDDCLPLGGPGRYQFVEFPLYNPDAPQKWALISQRLQSVDYVVLSSNRLYGSIMTAPDRYPQTTKFYKDLFADSLGFTPIAQFTSRPNIPLPGFRLCLTPPSTNYGQVARSLQDCPLEGISFVDDYADETFTVYDHPKVIIFGRQKI